MKDKVNKSTGYNKTADISALAGVALLGCASVNELIQMHELFLAVLAGVSLVIAAGLLLLVSKAAKTFPNLACCTPLILFIFSTALTGLCQWRFSYYPIACLCFCALSCLYLRFTIALGYILGQNIIVGIMILTGVPIMGPETPAHIVIVAWLLSCFSGIVMLILTRVSTNKNTKALQDQQSFKILLSTTPSYIAMVDGLNQVTYVSKPLSLLAGIGEPDFAIGRPLIDLFPDRTMKLLISAMLRQNAFYEDDWEVTLHGQKRYFKVVADKLTGNAKGRLINLHDMTHLAERNEIAIMKDSLKIGLFFMDKHYVIQDQYSRFLEEILTETGLAGKRFPDMLAASFTPHEVDEIQAYFSMIFDRFFDPSTLADLNPLDEFQYLSIKTGAKKIFHCGFATVERSRGELFILVTIYDITAKVELQRRLLEEENRRQEEMRSMFELIQVDPAVFRDFLEDAGYEFDQIGGILKNPQMSPDDMLVGLYQSVHAIKSNAVTVGLNTFGGKVHELESKIKKLRSQIEPVSSEDMADLGRDLEKLVQEKDTFKTTIDKIKSFKIGGDGRNQYEYILLESLSKTAEKVAADLEKQARFVPEEIDVEALEKGPRRVIKEVLMQLIRNSVVHGIESPEERAAAGKDETGIIRLSIKLVDGDIHIRLSDDGQGIDFNKIRAKAEGLNLIPKGAEDNRDILLKAMFSPGFSTAETEGIHAGRGIGLNLVQDRICESSGSIDVQTEPGKGTVFIIRLPINADPG
ncbi:MAG: Hpt domain-containing protein [Treponema sp.]|jgi:two-component system chemotaxis sensor kinase CheA|nr:Hpt domain-containing protein [Treponema sp.]